MAEQEQRNSTMLFSTLGRDGEFTIDLDSLVTKNYNYDKEMVAQALNSLNVSQLREMSAYFYTYSGVYRQMVQKTASIHYYRNVITPEFYLSKNNKFNEKIDKEVMKYYRASKVSNTCYNIGLEAIMYGSCNTYEIVAPNGNVVQQILPAEYCRTRSKDEFDNNIVEFNFSYFDAIANKMTPDEFKNLWKTLPKEFEKLYKNYKSNKSNCNDSKNAKWQKLDSNFARCTLSSLDGIPLFANTFCDILDYEDYKSIDSDRAKQKLFKLVVQKFGLGEDGEPICQDTMVTLAHKNLRKVVDGVAGSLTTAFDVSSVSLDDKAETSNIRYSEQSMDNLYNSSGTSQSVMGSITNAGANAVKASNTLLSSTLKFLTYQFENWYTKKFNEQSNGKIVYSFKILDINVFNESEVMTMYKNQLDLGGSLCLYVNAMGIDTNMYNSLLQYEKAIKIKDNMKPLVNSNQMASSDNPNGKKPDSEKTEETIRTDDVRQ